MAELGPEAPGYHAEVGRQAEGIDLVLGVGELARLYGPADWAPTAAEAREIALGLVRPGDAILVKGSRSVGLEIVADVLRGSGA
jgi:UDP-N-acetylmuramoyl-tripeptide--D-alanyl-D-alanine ligase